MATNPTLVLTIRHGKNEAVIAEVGMTDVSDVRMRGMMGLALDKLRNSIATDGRTLRDRACAIIKGWR